MFLVWDSPSAKWGWICRGCGHVAKRPAAYDSAKKQAATHEAKK